MWASHNLAFSRPVYFNALHLASPATCLLFSPNKGHDTLPRVLPTITSTTSTTSTTNNNAKPNAERRNTTHLTHTLNTMTALSLPPKASFLGIPPELRLQIYDRVVCLDIDVLIDKAPINMRRQSLGAMCKGACELPIKQLALVCRSIADEIRSHNRLLPSHQRVASLEVRAHSQPLTYPVHLRRLPCCLRQLSGLELEVRLDMPQLLMMDIQSTVRNTMNELSFTLYYLLDPEIGILRDATGIRDMWIRLVLAKPDYAIFGQVAFDKVERKLRVQAERELRWAIWFDRSNTNLHLTYVHC